MDIVALLGNSLGYSLQTIIKWKKKKKTVFLHYDGSIIEMGMLPCLFFLRWTSRSLQRALHRYFWQREMLEWRASAACSYSIVMGAVVI